MKTPGKEISVDIHTLGVQGDGIHGGGNRTVFVERTLPGETVRVRVRRDNLGLQRGDLVEVVTPSSHRKAPPCPHFSQCGNCTLQHTTDEYYRDWKTKLVLETLAKEKIRPRTWLPPVFLGPGQRRRATFTGKRIGDRFFLGYYGRRTKQVIDIKTCAVVTPKIFSLQEKLREALPSLLSSPLGVDFFFQQMGDHVELAVTGPVDMPKGEKALRTLARKSGLSGVLWRKDYDSTFQRVYKSERLIAQFGPLSVSLPPGAFLQPTEAGEKALLQAALKALPKEGVFADLFAGCGTFTGPLLERGKVDAYENDGAAVNSLTQAGQEHPNLRVIRRDLQQYPLTAKHLSQYDAVLLDPPRSGCAEQASTLARSRVPLCLSISCNPMTFARDAKILAQGGYRLESLQLVDQFTWSHHVELIGKFIR